MAHPGVRPACSNTTRSRRICVCPGEGHDHDDCVLIICGSPAGDVATLPPPGQHAAASLLVAERIPQAARTALAERGWSWLDLRGHLRLRAPGVFIDRQVAPREAAPRQSTGRAWREVAFALLTLKDDAHGVRPLARLLGLSPASVSQQLSALHQANLLDRAGRALVPELFWELAGRWKADPMPLLRQPQPGDPHALGLGLDGPPVAQGVAVGTPGWALTGTAAAVAWGAPIAASQDWPPDFLVPSPEQAMRAKRVLGAAPDWQTRACTIALSPVRQAILQRYEPLTSPAVAGAPWRLAHPVAVALNLAQDKARGAEVLVDWQADGFRRVW